MVDKQFFRTCPTPGCGREIGYTLKYTRDRSEREGKVCGHCISTLHNGFRGKSHTPETKAHLSVANLERQGAWSPEHKAEFRETMRDVYAEHHAGRPRKSNFEYQVERHGRERAMELDAESRAKQSAASSGAGNPMYGKPSPALSGSGWKGWYGEHFFRSLRELAFMTANQGWITGESNDWRASFEWNGGTRTTVPDFIIPAGHRVIECKPTRLHNTPLVQAKAEAMQALAQEKGFSYELVDPGIVGYADLTQLVQAGTVRLTDKTQEAFNSWQ